MKQINPVDVRSWAFLEWKYKADVERIEIRHFQKFWTLILLSYVCMPFSMEVNFRTSLENCSFYINIIDVQFYTFMNARIIILIYFWFGFSVWSHFKNDNLIAFLHVSPLPPPRLEGFRHSALEIF